MVFCAAQDSGYQDIAFPHQSELKANGDEIKANLRGLKNKPGSTRPVDITDHLRLNIRHYPNNVEFTYALTSKASDQRSFTQVSSGEITPRRRSRLCDWTLTPILSQRFYLVINLCRTVPVDRLVQVISAKKISKASVVQERKLRIAVT